ncbi:Asp23/Gls24 family envelope stress response protein [Streptomyces mirabilis]|uniref:Asp23/Gls24 family envelope stress response protein n=1 Tax=Streptomyces mirabilis TaxID=68239 RepID=UPI0036487FA1
MTPVTGPLGDTRRPSTAVEAAERGATRIADRVVAKIAAQAAREALDPLPPDAVPPHATVVVHHESARARARVRARVRLHLELAYPSDIGARCNAVRCHVAERVHALTGMEVPEVTVHVERLHLVPATAAAQGRTR